ncbi:MAG: VOC family protein [Actinomycetota bacterium]|nr:VOC family protein [Actinomycetota bacterium]
MSRVQLALNVDDLDTAVAFYSLLFETGPAKLRPGYANFAVADPPLKLVLFEQPGKGGTINHLGVEVETPELVGAARSRLAAQGMATATEDGVACCYARQDKVWVDGPSGEPWEIYTVLADVEMPVGRLRTVDPESGAVCCATTTDDAGGAASACF